MAKTRTEKRRIVYNYLRSVGYTPTEARALRNRFSLVKVVKARKKTKSKLDREVYEYYRYQLHKSAKEASRKKGRRRKVWEDQVEYFEENGGAIWSRRIPMPKIPPALYDHGVKYLANAYHAIHPERDYKSLIKEFSALNPDKMTHHIFRLERFLAKMPMREIKKFMDTLNTQSDIDDYYKQMTISSSKITRL